jgi:acyl-CoA synthetase (AMP-forming)/AMP-acid ligase II/acyl carrier protein
MSLDIDHADWTVPAQLRRRAAERPDDVAHRVAGSTALTFRDWDELSNAVAHGLTGLGVAPGDRVVLPCSTEGWVDYAVAWAGVLKAGAVAVPVPRSVGHARLTAIYQASGAVAAVGAMADIPAGLPGGRRCDIDGLARRRPTDPVTVPVVPGSDAEMIYTSGTTGLSKGVIATHENVLYPLMRPGTGAPPGTRQDTVAAVSLHALSPGTTVGQGLLAQPLGPVPHTVITLARSGAGELLRAIARERPTHVVLVPAMAIALVSTGARQYYDLGSVRQVRSTSAPIHPATLEQLALLFPAARIRNVYSTTEAWPRRLATDYDRSRPASLGRPAGGTQLRIMTADGQEAAAGAAGEVQLRSDAPQRRYESDDDSPAVFLSGGWTRTGDIGRIDADGYFYLIDRNPDLIITGGLNVSTISVEAAIMDFPGVIEAAVCGVPHPVLGECVMAAVRAVPGLDTDELIAYLRQREGSAAPHRLTLVGDLPRTLLGKVDKRRLRELLEIRADGAEDEPPSTPTEKLVADIWAAILDREQVSATDDFLACGGSSLTAMEVISLVEEELGKRVRVRDLLDTTSLRDFAGRVDSAPPGSAQPE